jgi:lipopolysaccharide/colanic/teichoic acid biosynthesis glycosyltransferase
MTPRGVAVFEKLAGCILLVVAAPVITAAALVISTLSKRSPFVAHLRVGQRGGGWWML